MSNYPRKIEVSLTEKQYRYLQMLCLLKRKRGVSEVIREIVEQYRNSHRI